MFLPKIVTVDLRPAELCSRVGKGQTGGVRCHSIGDVDQGGPLGIGLQAGGELASGLLRVVRAI